MNFRYFIFTYLISEIFGRLSIQYKNATDTAFETEAYNALPFEFNQNLSKDIEKLDLILLIRLDIKYDVLDVCDASSFTEEKFKQLISSVLQSNTTYSTGFINDKGNFTVDTVPWIAYYNVDNMYAICDGVNPVHYDYFHYMTWYVQQLGGLGVMAHWTSSETYSYTYGYGVDVHAKTVYGDVVYTPSLNLMKPLEDVLFTNKSVAVNGKLRRNNENGTVQGLFVNILEFQIDENPWSGM